MNLNLDISEHLKSAMKEREVVKLGILRVLKSEIQRNEQSPTGKIQLANGDIIKLIKKLIEGIKETTNNLEEISILEDYLPKQMTEHDIRAIISPMSFKHIGDVMKHFKTNYDGLYDGKALSLIAKEYIA